MLRAASAPFSCFPPNHGVDSQAGGRSASSDYRPRYVGHHLLLSYTANALPHASIAQYLAAPQDKQDPFCFCELSNSTQGQTKVDKGGGQTPVWDEEFRFTVYEVEGEQQKLKITVMRQEHKQESEVVGEAYVAIDGKWKDNEFDGEYRCGPARSARRELQLQARLSGSGGASVS